MRGVFCLAFARGLPLSHFTGLESFPRIGDQYRSSFPLQNQWSETADRLIWAEFAIRPSVSFVCTPQIGSRQETIFWKVVWTWLNLEFLLSSLEILNRSMDSRGSGFYLGKLGSRPSFADRFDSVSRCVGPVCFILQFCPVPFF